jgi:hypothetical protein
VFEGDVRRWRRVEFGDSKKQTHFGSDCGGVWFLPNEPEPGVPTKRTQIPLACFALFSDSSAALSFFGLTWFAILLRVEHNTIEEISYVIDNNNKSGCDCFRVKPYWRRNSADGPNSGWRVSLQEELDAKQINEMPTSHSWAAAISELRVTRPSRSGDLT